MSREVGRAQLVFNIMGQFCLSLVMSVQRTTEYVHTNALLIRPSIRPIVHFASDYDMFNTSTFTSTPYSYMVHL